MAYATLTAMHDTPPPSSEPPDQWAETSRRLHAFSDRLLVAGWATRVAISPDAVVIDYTPAGRKKMRQLLALCDELDFPTFKKDDMFGLWLVAQLGPPPS